MRACVLLGIGDLRCEEVSTPGPRPGEALIGVGACGVCGSDVARVFTKGTYSFPRIIGHEVAGTVEAVGPDTDASWVGKAVVVFPLIPCRRCGWCAVGEYALCRDYNYIGSRCDGGFADYLCAPVWNLLTLPEGVSVEEAAMTEPAAVAFHALRQGRLTRGETVAVFGAGPIGLLVGQWAREWGAQRVLLIDIDARKLDFAANLGFPDGFHTGEGSPAEWVRGLTGEGADLVIEASGSPAAFEESFKAACPLGRVVLLGNPSGAMSLSQDSYWVILRNQLTVVGAWNSSYQPVWTSEDNLSAPARRTALNEWALALEYVAEGRIDVRSLITHRVGLEAIPELLVKLRDRTELIGKGMYLAAAR